MKKTIKVTKASEIKDNLEVVPSLKGDLTVGAVTITPSMENMESFVCLTFEDSSLDGWITRKEVYDLHRAIEILIHKMEKLDGK